MRSHISHWSAELPLRNQSNIPASQETLETKFTPSCHLTIAAAALKSGNRTCGYRLQKKKKILLFMKPILCLLAHVSIYEDKLGQAMSPSQAGPGADLWPFLGVSVPPGPLC